MKKSTDMSNRMYMPIELIPAALTVTAPAVAKRACFAIAGIKRHEGARRATGSESTT